MNSHKEAELSKSCGFGIETIKEILPHRYPFLLVDRVLEIGQQRIVAVKNVSANEPFFQGHFPGKPIMPGVLMVEALAQAGGILILVTLNKRGMLAYLASISHARFRRMVVPGDRLELRVEITRMKSKVAVLKGVAAVDGEEACEVELMVSFSE